MASKLLQPAQLRFEVPAAVSPFHPCAASPEGLPMKTSFGRVLQNVGKLLIRSSASRRSPAGRRSLFSKRLTVEALEFRRLLATLFVENPAGYSITTDTAPAGLSAGDTVTWNPGTGSQHGGPVAGLTFRRQRLSTIQWAVNAASGGIRFFALARAPTPRPLRSTSSFSCLAIRSARMSERPGRASESIVTGARENGPRRSTSRPTTWS